MFSRTCLLGLLVWCCLAAMACQATSNPRAIVTPPRAIVTPTAATTEWGGPTATAPAGVPASLPTSSPELLALALRQLDTSIGYRYSITGTLAYNADGKPVEWRYNGQGGTTPPDRYEWSIQQSAGKEWHVVSVAGQAVCEDSRGPVAEGCGLAWGGPSVGTSPYTALAYLRFADQMDSPEPARLGDREYHHFTFTPSLSRLAGLDDSHQDVVRQVSRVTGEAWVDRTDGHLRRLQVSAISVTAAGREQQATMALTFFDLGKPVDIALPKAGR